MRKTNLIKEGLKYKFFNDKEEIINDYLNGCEEGYYARFNYTNGKSVIVCNENAKAFSRNGFFFSVILKDEDYINNLDEEEILEYLDGRFSAKYEEPEEEYEDIEEELEDE